MTAQRDFCLGNSLFSFGTVTSPPANSRTQHNLLTAALKTDFNRAMSRVILQEKDQDFFE